MGRKFEFFNSIQKWQGAKPESPLSKRKKTVFKKTLNKRPGI